MKAKINNTTHLEGYVYENNLELRISGESSKNPGTEFISGMLGIATDEEALNVVQVHFTYVTAITAKGKPNNTFNVLKAIIDGKIGTIMDHGKENAGMIRIDSAIGLREWYDRRTGNSELISIKGNEGGFVHQTQVLNKDVDSRATFNVDMLITNTNRIEADEERNTPERLILKGYIFDFRKAILPVDFTVLLPRAMDYFEGLDITSKTPVFTHLQGIQISKTVTKQKVEDSAFGDAKVTEVQTSQRDFVVTWASPDTYEWDSEDGILATELMEALSNREIYLSDMKRRQEEYQQTKGNTFSSTPNIISKDDYDF